MPIEKIDSLDQAIGRLKRPMYQLEHISILKGLAIFMEENYSESGREIKDWSLSFAERMPFMSSSESCQESKEFLAELEAFKELLT